MPILNHHLIALKEKALTNPTIGELLDWIPVAQFFLGHLPNTEEIKIINRKKLIPNFPLLNNFYRHIGPWHLVLEAAVTFKNYSEYHPQRKSYTRGQLIRALLQFHDEFGYFPSGIEFENTPGYPSRTPYIREFGSFEAGLKIAQALTRQRLGFTA